jgi:ureidoglycolate lyase
MDDVATLERVRLKARRATPEALAPYGEMIGRVADAPAQKLNYYAGEIRKPARFISDEDTQISVATLQRRPLEVRWLERHFKHTQSFIPLGGKPFVLVMAPPTDGDMPDLGSVEAFVFDGSAGFCMKIGCWHEFPFVLVDDTDLIVILRGETHRELQTMSNGEAHGADLDKKDMPVRTGKVFEVAL